MRTEISAKFRREGVEAELAAAGLELTDWWTDPAGDFALSLSRRPDRPASSSPRTVGAPVSCWLCLWLSRSAGRLSLLMM